MFRSFSHHLVGILGLLLISASVWGLRAWVDRNAAARSAQRSLGKRVRLNITKRGKK